MASELTMKELKSLRPFGKTLELENALEGEMSSSSQILQPIFLIMQEGLPMMTLSQRLRYDSPYFHKVESMILGYFDG